MPTAITSLAGFFTAIGFAADTALFLSQVFVYATTSFLLNRAAAALTPKSKGPGLGTADASNYYGPMIEVTP